MGMNKFKHKKIRLTEFTLSNKELERLSKLDSGIVLRKNCHCHLKLNYSATPISSPNFKNAIMEELSKRVLNYNVELNDMILRYSNIRVRQPIEATRSRKLGVTCIADVYVFKPQCGSILNATVNKKSENHLGCIMYNVFNVSIIRPSDLPYKKWAGRDINLDDEINFKVVKVDVSEVIPYIIGELTIDNDDISLCRDNEEKDSVISADRSCSTSEGQYSDLDDVLESIKDVKSRKRKNSQRIEPEKPTKKRKLKLSM